MDLLISSKEFCQTDKADNITVNTSHGIKPLFKGSKKISTKINTFFIIAKRRPACKGKCFGLVQLRAYT